MKEAQLKQRAESCYRSWLAGRGFEELAGQREMMMFIADVLGAESGKIGLVEAGTGTGKTIAYAIAGLLAAEQSRDLRLIIVTKTVALQEQILHRDLPDLRKHSRLQFDFTVAKGRSRYLCLKLLDAKVTDTRQRSVLKDSHHAREEEAYRDMLDAFENSQWTGDLDLWRGEISPDVRTAVTNDHRGCTGDSCEFRKECPYFAARAGSYRAKVIVTNYALLLTDLRHEAGVLPISENCLVILDEAHNLPEIARTIFAQILRLGDISKWPTDIKLLSTRVPGQFPHLLEPFNRVIELVHNHEEGIRGADRQLREYVSNLKFDSSDSGKKRVRLDVAELPLPLSDPASELWRSYSAIASLADNAFAEINEAVEVLDEDSDLGETVDWLAQFRELIDRVSEIEGGLRSLSEEEAGRPWARWIDAESSAYRDTVVHLVPLDVGGLLSRRLWKPCAGAICTSATLCTTEGFDFFLESVGLPKETPQLQVESPFDFRKNVVLHVPSIRAQPPQSASFVAEVVRILPEVLVAETTALVLFTSRKMLTEVYALLPRTIQSLCLMQGDLPVDALRRAHRKRVRSAKPSYILGLATMGEGIDMPGDLCRHVIVVRLPFAVPNDPIFQSRVEWLARQTGKHNPGFAKISLPEATLRLKQACGRLIRKREDSGRITILDRRIVEKSYGKAILGALPPYRRQIDPNP